jgi:hypothetical protein
LGIDESTLETADAHGLAQQLLRQLGFPVPSVPDYTFRSSLEAARACASDIQLGQVDAAIGSFMLAAQEIEAVMRASSITWSMTCVYDWQEPLEAILVHTSGQADGLSRLSLGHWKSIFCRLPDELLSRDDVPPDMSTRLENYKRALKKTVAVAKFDALVKVRNDVAHRVDQIRALPLSNAHAKLAEPLTTVLAVLEHLQADELLPVVVQPVEERCDAYGRRTIRFLAEGGRTVEVFSPHERDLSVPYIWLRRLTNPKDVRPQLLELSTVMQALP